MRDKFFTKSVCDRCRKPLTGGFTMSMYNTQCVCMDCAQAERERPDYKEAAQAERKACRNGDYNFLGIGL